MEWPRDATRHQRCIFGRGERAREIGVVLKGEIEDLLYAVVESIMIEKSIFIYKKSVFFSFFFLHV